MMKKRILALIASGVLTAGAIGAFAGCGGDSDAVKLTLWGPAEQQATLAAMVEEFKAANPDTKYDIKVDTCGEDMTVSKVGSDPDTAADVFGYVSDQLVPLLRVGALAELGGIFLDNVVAENTQASVDAGTFNDAVYGYPYAGDNTYFMYYDKSVVSEDKVGSLEEIIDACNAAGKKIAWAFDLPWYTAGWFFSFGCDFSVEYGDAQNPYSETNATCNFNNADGVLASKAMEQLVASGAMLSGTGLSDSIIKTKFQTGEIAVAVSGTWNAREIEGILGEDKYGVCELPTVTVDGRTEHLRSFMGYKFYGVNRHSKNLIEAHKLAAFLSGEAMQLERFEKHNIGPTNNVVAELDEVKNNPAIKAVKAQMPYTRLQESAPGDFWEPLKGYGVNVIGSKIKDSNRQSP